MSSRFSRSLPPRPDLAQQKKQAKELLRAFDAGDVEALARVRAELPDKQDIALADAQFVLAREYGFTNWMELSRHIDTQTEATRSPIARMHDALQRRDAKAIRHLFAHHEGLRSRINDPIFSFNSPAIVAFADDPAIVEVLLEFGADPNRRSTWWAGGFHALYAATGVAAERLLAAGAVPDACAAAHLDRPDLLAGLIAERPGCVHDRGGDGKTPLHFAESVAVIDTLLAAGADIDARDVDHRSTAAQWMLDRAPGEGRYELARYLVKRGATTDIFLAAALGLTNRVREMLHADPALLDLRTGRGEYGAKPPSSYHIYFWTIGDSRSPMDVAAQFEHADVLDAMRDVASPLQRLLFAARGGDADAARSVVREHPRLMEALTPADHRAVADAAWNGDARAVALMLELGFDPRARGHDGGTALHCAAWEGSVECVAALLERPDSRALVALEDAHYKATPLGWCRHGSLHGNTTRDHPRIARMLLEAGADPGPEESEASPAVEVVLRAWRRSGSPRRPG